MPRFLCLCGFLASWPSVFASVWITGALGMWNSGCQDIGQCGVLEFGCFGRVGLWSFGYLSLRASVLAGIRTFGVVDSWVLAVTGLRMCGYVGIGYCGSEESRSDGDWEVGIVGLMALWRNGDVDYRRFGIVGEKP